MTRTSMAVRGIKKKAHENLSDSNIRKAMSLLNPKEGTPVTKKEACNILNIAYNTTRLQRIFNDYQERQDNIARRKAANRGRRADTTEIKTAITEYLAGDSVSEIAKGLFRSPSFVRSIIERTGVPQRPTSKEDKQGIDYIPDSCVADIFQVGEIVWSAKHHTTAIIKEELSLEYQQSRKGVIPVDYEKKYGSKMYSIYVTEAVDSDDTFFPHIASGGYFAVSPAYDLGKLSHLEKYGVDLNRV